MVTNGYDKPAKGSSPAARGGAGAYIEGELGALYLMTMLAGAEPRGMRHAAIHRVRFQGADKDFALDDIVIHGVRPSGPAVLEIQSKRDATFAPKDSIFESICAQIAKVGTIDGIAADDHLLAAATQRTSRQISGSYQDVLEWARCDEDATSFFARLAAPGVANPEMRSFVTTFRAHLVAHGVADDDATIWQLLRRFQIIEFDFESSAPQARGQALFMAQIILAPGDGGRADALWSTLIEIALATAKTGGAIDRAALCETLTNRGFRLAGNRSFADARARLADMARHALAAIGTDIDGFHLPRHGAIAAIDAVLDTGRYVEIRGGPGVGKSALLAQLAQRLQRESPIIVLDPIGTPGGGWIALAQALGVDGTARAFLADLALAGGATLFIDNIDMVTDPGRRRTVNDLLREVATIEGFSVVATARSDADHDADSWIAADAITRLGGARPVEIKELDDAEVAVLCDRAPSLGALLAPGHPAATIARNLYRLSRLLQTTDSGTIRTEADLAESWWTTGDGAPADQHAAARRILIAVADAAIAGEDGITLTTDSPARAHLLGRLSLREPRLDRLTVYHDVLRHWAVGLRLHDDPTLLARLDLSRAAPLALARGVEFAARLALERSEGTQAWDMLLSRISGPAAHGSWRRHALLGLLRSERAVELLERHSARLLHQGGRLMIELVNATSVAETRAAAELFAGIDLPGADVIAQFPPSIRLSVTPSARRLLSWAVRHEAELWTQIIPPVLRLVEIQTPMNLVAPGLAGPTAAMLFRLLRQADIHNVPRSLKADPEGAPLEGSAYLRMVEDLRSTALLNAAADPDGTKAYLTALTPERDHYKVKAVRRMSGVIAPVAPRELADLVEASLIEPAERTSRHHAGRDRVLSHADTDYLPASPAQRPFLDLLEADAAIGLGLIRRLTVHAVAFYAGGNDPGAKGITLLFDDGPRFFPWTDTYLWTRGQAREYSVASGLLALEAWGHKRLEQGENIADVLADILGPEGSCAAYVMVAIDLLMSHGTRARAALVPFVACPELLALDRQRQARDQMGGDHVGIGDEPDGPVRIKDLRATQSRAMPLEQLLPYYLKADPAGDAVRARLADAVGKLRPYDDNDDFADAAFMGRYAANMLDIANWKEVEGGLGYHSPPEEARHIEKLQASRADLLRSSDVSAKIQLAIWDRAKGSPAVACDAADFADNGTDPHVGELADDMKETRRVSTALLIARDGDDALLDAKEAWVRDVVAGALAQQADRYRDKQFAYNRQALAACALAHLWLRRRKTTDRDALVALGAREDRCGASAFEQARIELVDAEPRLIKAAMRVAFATNRWRRPARNTTEDAKDAAAAQKATHDAAAIAAEIAWLQGGAEPDWPAFPDEIPIIRRSNRITLNAEGARAVDDQPSRPARRRPVEDEVHVDSRALAHWLQIAAEASPALDWLPELVAVYGDWTAVMNGHGLPAEAEIDREPSEWNAQFYALAARVMLEGSAEAFDRQVELVVALPDRSFGDVGEILLHAADIWYFNDATRPSERAVALRARHRDRAMKLSRWGSNLRPGDLSINWDTGGIVARLCFNHHAPLGKTSTYLVPAVFDRVDPLLDTLAPMMLSGPTPFIALCTLNMLMVAPRARHAGFLVAAAEAWLDRLQGDASIWTELGLGRRVVEWLNAAAVEDPALLAPGHELRVRADAVLGRLIAFGVAEAHELEGRIQRAATLPAGNDYGA
ncbi:ATP-binding protein [Rhizorhabdus argentea]|uniref:ATP-binding protein n=1 Tax=Rhizorhabdus argentea TaxID=1387174 RepID=UPI0030EB2FD5